MAKRFNNLKAALKLLRPLSGEGQAADLPDTTALGFFQAVQAGKKSVEYGDRDATSKPGELVIYALIPFATPVNTATKVLVSVSNRSENNIGTTGLTVAELNISKSNQDVAAASEISDFIPARATVRIPGTAETTKTSKLTGQRYKTRGGRSYTYPIGFGVGETAKGYKDVKAAISDKVKEGETRRSVSFSPEIYR